jgi:hypothetical protein
MACGDLNDIGGSVSAALPPIYRPGFPQMTPHQRSAPLS